MLKVEVQFVSKCPLAAEMISNVKTAISKLDFDVDYVETAFNNGDEKENIRGCPTLLVDGRDYEGKIKFDKKKPFCREYRNGLPTAEEIQKFIMYNY